MTISEDQLEQLLELDDQNTNVVLAYAIAIIAQDEALTGSQLTRLAEVGERVIAGAVVLNYSAPTVAVRLAVERHPDLRAVAEGNPNAPTEWKLDLPGREVTALSLDVFFSEVSATKAEKAKAHRRLAAHDGRTLREVWLEVRPK
jgi:hypothetical protein